MARSTECHGENIPFIVPAFAIEWLAPPPQDPSPPSSLFSPPPSAPLYPGTSSYPAAAGSPLVLATHPLVDARLQNGVKS